jgi:hypothetical protein
MCAMIRFVPQKKPGITFWKVCRWIILCGLVVVIFLILKKPPAVTEALAPEAVSQRSDEVQTKVADLEQAHQRGEAAEARFSSEEINAVFQHAQNEAAGAFGAAQSTPTGGSEQNPAAPEKAPEISTTQVAFAGDHATGQFVVRGPGGKDIYLTFSAKIKAVNGYASFEFTEGKIGDMPVPISLLNARLQQKLQDPETRLKLKLPDFVADIHVENGQLVMVEK